LATTTSGTTAPGTTPSGSATASPAQAGAAPSGGSFAVGDCVFVASTTSTTLDNAKIVRQRCDATDGFFAKVLARVATKADCPADTTISRISDGTQILCLGQGDRGSIAKPGDCVRVPTGFTLPLIRTDCATSPRPLQLVAVIDEGRVCPSGTPGQPFSGYDRLLCIHYPTGT
jgi:hypothetical protein